MFSSLFPIPFLIHPDTQFAFLRVTKWGRNWQIFQVICYNCKSPSGSCQIKSITLFTDVYLLLTFYVFFHKFTKKIKIRKSNLWLWYCREISQSAWSEMLHHLFPLCWSRSCCVQSVSLGLSWQFDWVPGPLVVGTKSTISLYIPLNLEKEVTSCFLPPGNNSF